MQNWKLMDIDIRDNEEQCGHFSNIISIIHGRQRKNGHVVLVIEHFFVFNDKV